jgi:hypothetical protein
MAAPNLISFTTATGKAVYQLLTTSAANVLVNASSSNQVYKINSIVVANYTSGSITTTVTVLRSATSFYLAGAIVVPANSSLVILGKDTTIYLEEGDTIQGLASANSSAHINISYELIQ